MTKPSLVHYGPIIEPFDGFHLVSRDTSGVHGPSDALTIDRSLPKPLLLNATVLVYQH